MPATFRNINSIATLDALFENSHDAPIILFKHSITCGISSGVYREVAKVNAGVNIVLIQTDRPLSDEIERRTGVRHESPQAIVLRNGAVIYHASHYDITPEDIESVLIGVALV